MELLFWITGIVLGLVWLDRVRDVLMHRHLLPDLTGPEWDVQPTGPNGRAPRVSIVVPAKEEEEAIGEALTLLLSMDYSNYEVIAVNDRSTDRTGQIVEEIAARHREQGSGPQLKVVHISELPAGWLGKNHAMWRGAQEATGEWILFTDGDVFYRPDALRRAIAFAEDRKADHFVLMPSVIQKSFGEHLMVGYFSLLYVFGFRPWKVNDPKAPDHVGIGAFNLVRKPAYEAIGTYAVLRFEVLDDVKLGKRIKEHGFRQFCTFGPGLVSVRWGVGLRGMLANLQKNLFSMGTYRWWVMAVLCLGTIGVSVVPFAGLLFAPGWSRIGYAVAVTAIALLYLGGRRNTGVPWYYFSLQWLSALIFTGAMISSTWRPLREGSIVWRGTRYPLDQLRAGMESQSVWYAFRPRPRGQHVR